MTWTFNKTLRIALGGFVGMFVALGLGYDLTQWEYWGITVPVMLVATFVAVVIANMIWPDP